MAWRCAGMALLRQVLRDVGSDRLANSPPSPAAAAAHALDVIYKIVLSYLQWMNSF